jgi:hypothetical protein
VHTKRTYDRSGKDIFWELNPLSISLIEYPFQLLFDLYWNNPGLLETMMRHLAIPRPEHRQYEWALAADAQNLELIRGFFYPYGPRQDDALACDMLYLRQLDSDRRIILSIQDQELRDCTESFIRSWKTDNLQRSYYTRSHAWAACQQFLMARLEICRVRVRESIRKFLLANRGRQEEIWGSDDSNEVDLEARIKRRLELPGTECVVLCAVSNSGKTRAIERLLSRHFGFYFQACYVRSDVEGIHSPQRRPGSNDTLLMGQMIKLGIMTSQGAENVEPLWVQSWLQYLVECRMAIFSDFLQIATELGVSMSLLPRLWFELQVNSEEDLFIENFQLTCLSKTQTTMTRNSIWQEGFSGPRQLYFCIDEVQADLEIEIPSSSGPLSLVSHWRKCLSSAISILFGYEDKDKRPLIFSGTSLKTSQVVSAINAGDELAHIPDPDECAIFSDFPAIKNDRDFYQVMQKHQIRESEHFFDVEQTILEHSRPLYGRAGWSARYLEAVGSILSSETASVFKKRIRKAARDTAIEIRDDLQGRLHQLSDGVKLMDHLCDVVIWSDILDCPTAFYSEDGPTMVAQGYAIMKSTRAGSHEYFLEEKLALEAAKDFFLVEMPVLVEASLGRLLASQVTNASAF